MKMKVVYKYPMNGAWSRQMMSLPIGAKVLSAQLQDGTLYAVFEQLGFLYLAAPPVPSSRVS